MYSQFFNTKYCDVSTDVSSLANLIKNLIQFDENHYIEWSVKQTIYFFIVVRKYRNNIIIDKRIITMFFFIIISIKTCS